MRTSIDMLVAVMGEILAVFASTLLALSETPTDDPIETFRTLWRKQVEDRRNLTVAEIEMLEMVKSSLEDLLAGRSSKPPDLRLIE